jgi:ribonucleoside-diphosphate reductase alpha chain
MGRDVVVTPEALKLKVSGKPSAVLTREIMGACPECGFTVEHEGGCVVCRDCGFTKCG